MPYRFLSLCLILILPTSGHAWEVSRIIDGKPIVVELFTSQGCSSCPPADHLLSRLSTRRNILALSQHVDYWNYIGWSDPYSSEATSNRQRSYAAHMGMNRIYTPQAVVAGVIEGIGSSPVTMRKAIAQAPRPITAMTISIDKDQAHFHIAASEDASPNPSVVWVAELNAKRTDSITRGENDGKSLTHSHVVRDFYAIAQWNGEETRYVIDLPQLWKQGRDGVAVIVQEGDNATGVIDAAAALFIRP